MKIGVLGTGVVGQTIAGKFAELGHSVHIGTRDVVKTNQGDFAKWKNDHSEIKLVTFSDAAAHGEILVNATSGVSSLAALKLAGITNLGGKILIDIANPLDFSKGMPPTLSVCNDSSLGEEIQAAFPEVKVVKTLNTMTASVMVEPVLVPGDHNVFVAGNDAGAKAAVIDILNTFGWKTENVIDLGDITGSRGTEMFLPLWLRLWGTLQTPMMNIKIMR